MSLLAFLNTQSGEPKPCMPLPSEAIIKHECESYVSAVNSSTQHSSLVLNRAL